MIHCADEIKSSLSYEMSFVVHDDVVLDSSGANTQSSRRRWCVLLTVRLQKCVILYFLRVSSEL